MPPRDQVVSMTQLVILVLSGEPGYYGLTRAASLAIGACMRGVDMIVSQWGSKSEIL